MTKAASWAYQPDFARKVLSELIRREKAHRSGTPKNADAAHDGRADELGEPRSIAKTETPGRRDRSYEIRAGYTGPRPTTFASLVSVVRLQRGTTADSRLRCCTSRPHRRSRSPLFWTRPSRSHSTIVPRCNTPRLQRALATRVLSQLRGATCARRTRPLATPRCNMRSQNASSRVSVQFHCDRRCEPAPRTGASRAGATRCTAREPPPSGESRLHRPRACPPSWRAGLHRPRAAPVRARRLHRPRAAPVPASHVAPRLREAGFPPHLVHTIHPSSGIPLASSRGWGREGPAEDVNG
jgi:hypothetical protein